MEDLNEVIGEARRLSSLLDSGIDVERFGMPHSLTADKADDAKEWLDQALPAGDET